MDQIVNIKPLSYYVENNQLAVLYYDALKHANDYINNVQNNKVRDIISTLKNYFVFVDKDTAIEFVVSEKSPNEITLGELLYNTMMASFGTEFTLSDIPVMKINSEKYVYFLDTKIQHNENCKYKLYRKYSFFNDDLELINERKDITFSRAFNSLLTLNQYVENVCEKEGKGLYSKCNGNYSFDVGHNLLNVTVTYFYIVKQ